MRVIVAGASGTLGGALVPRLIAAGHDVVGLVRSQSSAKRIEALGATALHADVLDRDGLLRAVEGQRADAVIHELTALRTAPTHYRSMRATNELRERGTAILLEAAGAVGATRVLTQSIVFGYGYRTAHPSVVDESAPFAAAEGAPVDAVHRALLSTEAQVRSAGGVALRYGLFYGLDAPQVRAMLAKRMLPVTSHTGVIPFIHHDDAAAATVAALEHGVSGRAYNVADDTPVTWRHYAESAARALDAPAPLRVPAWLLRIATPYAAELMTRLDLRVSSQLAHDELGWSPRYASVDDGWVGGSA